MFSVNFMEIVEVRETFIAPFLGVVETTTGATLSITYFSVKTGDCLPSSPIEINFKVVVEDILMGPMYSVLLLVGVLPLVV